MCLANSAANTTLTPRAQGEDAAILYDLDSLAWGPEQEQLVKSLSTRPLNQPTAVHSYGLEKAQVKTLQENGILVHRCLERELFVHLVRLLDGWGKAAA